MLNFISDDILFSILFLDLVIRLCVKNSSWGKLSELSTVEHILRVLPSLFLLHFLIYSLVGLKVWYLFYCIQPLYIITYKTFAVPLSTFAIPLLFCFDFSNTVKICELVFSIKLNYNCQILLGPASSSFADIDCNKLVDNGF